MAKTRSQGEDAYVEDRRRGNTLAGGAYAARGDGRGGGDALFLPAFEQSLGDALVAGLERVLDRRVAIIVFGFHVRAVCDH